MLFILQKESQDLDIDVLTLKEELKHQKMSHQYMEASLSEMKAMDLKHLFGKNLKQLVPVGSLEFVQEFLKIHCGIPNMWPIEIPSELRLPHLLNREYQLLDDIDVAQISGKKFLKYASSLKLFSYWGDIQQLIKSSPNMLRSGVYVVSELVEFVSEYRIFVHRDKIVGLQFYDGNPLALLSKDNLKKIQEAVLRYSQNKNKPKSYTLDVGVLQNGDIAIIEVHPWCSVGLYGCSGGFLPDAYIDGFQWYLQYNTPLIADNPRKSAEEILMDLRIL